MRGLVQLLVTLGIVSVAVAAIGVTQTSLWNLLAIPLSAIGGWYSWRQRYRRNIAVKFFIAFGMLMALTAFLTRMIGQPGDTRIMLAELLIQLQVLHSFDLPRRKDLGYSMMIGLILLGVAATISQTLAFGPILLLFLTVAMPVLVLDYRSRLGLINPPWRQFGAQIAPRRLGALLLLVLGLGMVIFLMLPRLPGYQLRNFPVSTDIDYQGQFDGQAIINPGYVNGGSSGDGTDSESDGDGQGSGDIDEAGKLSGPGVVDQTSYYGFNRQMNQNLRGDLTPQEVMRVRSQSPGFWRVVSFDRYTGQGWEISRNENVMTLRRSRFTAQTILPRQRFIGRDREVIQTYTLVSDFSNLIPALYQPEQLYFPTQEVAIDPDGNLRSPVALEKGMTYTVVSEVPYRDRTRLRLAPKGYPDEIRDYYLQVPADLQAPVRELTESLLSNAPQPLEDPYEKALFLAQALKQRYTVQPNMPFLRPEEDLVNAFLFEQGGGLPDHFSTVLTIMLRSIDIPARLTAGFSPGEFNPFTGFYIVSNTDAYAITEVYFPEYGWFGFNPIPGFELVPPTIEDYEAFGIVRQFWNWVAGRLPSPVTAWIEGTVQTVFELLQRTVLALVGLFGKGWIGAIAGLAALTAMAFVGWLGWLGWRSGRQRWRLRQLPAMERLYQQMLLKLAHQGHPKKSTETPWEYVRRLLGKEKVNHQPAQEISDAYVRWRYGGEPPDINTLKTRLKQLTLTANRGRTP
ncbi:transglutaminase [filamentous cyanobacterium CCP5]|nr:transglutaminase [filamentous cyanobacterium CCP5]